MEIRNRLFPYPVLCSETDDYTESADLLVESHCSETINEIILNYDFNIRCDALETLIRKGDAQFVLHVECSTTSYRTALKTDGTNIQYRIPKRRVNGEIYLVLMIVAKKDIDDYISTDLNEDYEGENISFDKGSILAYTNLPKIVVVKNTEELAGNDSLFTVVKRVSLDSEEIRPLEFNLNDNKIKIFVDEKTYESFIRLQSVGSLGMAMLVLPALTYMITEVYNDPEGYSSYGWFVRLKNFYKANGKDFIEDIIQQENNPVMIAQEMLQNPVSCAYRSLLELEG